MAGERTPDNTPGHPGGGRSSDDDISLREHMQRQTDANARIVERMHESQQAYFERVIADMWQRLDERFAAQQNAVNELKTATAQRFESVNEFRAQLNEQANKFMGRDESISRHERTAEAMNINGLRHDNEMRLMRERTDQELRLVRERLDADIKTVNSRLDRNQGQEKGVDKTWTFIVAGAGFVATVVSLVAYAIGAQ